MRTLRSWQLEFTALAAIWASSFMFNQADRRALAARCGWRSAGQPRALTLLAIALAKRQSLRFKQATVGRTLAVVAVLFKRRPVHPVRLRRAPRLLDRRGLWNATTPLWTLIGVSLALRGERPNGAARAGLALGFVGALLILMPWRALGSGRLDGELACAAAAACYGAGFTYIPPPESPAGRRGAIAFVCGAADDRNRDARRAPAGQLLTAVDARASRIAGVLSTRDPRERPRLPAQLRHPRAGPARRIASTVTYVSPLFSTVLGILALGETLSWIRAARRRRSARRASRSPQA